MVTDTARDGQPRLRIMPFNETAVVMGKGSRSYEEVYLDRCREDGITVYRRLGGGCAVVLDPGNLVVSVTLPVPGLGETKHWFNACTHWMADTLNEVGVKGVYSDGVSDLVLDNRKIAGSALYRRKGVVFYAVTILVEADRSLITRYLPHPPREPEYRKGRPHDRFTVNISEVYPGITVAELTRRLEDKIDLGALYPHPES